MKDLQNTAKLHNIIRSYGAKKENILKILLAIQAASDKNYISEEAATVVASELGITTTEIYEIITFYAMFSTKPRGKYIIELCKSAPCHIKQANTVVEMFEKKLGIQVGETTQDHLFTLEYTNCIGACEMSPAVKIGNQIYGNLNSQKIGQILRQYTAQAVIAGM